MQEVLVNHLGGLSLPRKSVVRLTDRPDMTLGVYCGRKTTIQQQQQQPLLSGALLLFANSAIFSFGFLTLMHSERPKLYRFMPYLRQQVQRHGFLKSTQIILYNCLFKKNILSIFS